MRRLSRRELLVRSAQLAPALVLPQLVLSACSDDKKGTAGGTGSETQVLVGFGTGNAPEQIAPQKALAEKYAKANAGSSVDFLRIPDTDEAQRKFGVLLASGDVPNVILPTGLFGISLYLDQNVWLNLSDLMEGSGVTLDLFEPATHDAARAVNYHGADSTTVVGLPAGLFTHAVAYNKELFAKAGVEEPPHQWDTPDWTYDKLVEVAGALTHDSQFRTPKQPGFDAGKITQFGLGHWDTGVMTLGHGGKVYTPGSRKLSLDSPEYVAGVQAGADLVNVHHVLADDELAAGVAAGADDPQLAAWKSGKVAMIDMCACDLLSFGVDNEFAWDVAAWPRGPERLIAHLNVDFGTIVAKSGQDAQSWKLLRFLLTDPENARTLSTQAYGAMSPLKSESGKFVEQLQGRFPGVDLQVFIDALPHSANEQEVWYPAFTEVGDLGGQFLDSVRQGQATAAEQLPKYQEAAQKKVDQWFASNKLPSAEPGPGGAVRTPRLTASRREALAAYGLVSPWALGFVGLTLGPMVASLVLSFTSYELVNPDRSGWVGAGNYHEALTADPLVWQSLKVTAYYVVLAVVFELVVGFALATLLNVGFRGIGAVRTVYYLPAVVSGVAVSLLWLLIFQPSSGLANSVLGLFGLDGVRWVYSTTWVVPAFVLMSVWGVGRAAFIYLAILQRIPTNLYEAAAVDGVGPFSRFLRITLPLATPAIFLNLVLAVIGKFQIFTEAFVVSEGGPGNSSLFFVLYLYRTAFRYFRVGYASALAWLLFLVLLGLTLVAFRTSRHWVYYEGERSAR